MSIAQNPLFTSLRKSFANVTTYSLNGQNIIRAKAFLPKNPKTVAQNMHRASFKLISLTYQSFGGYADPGFVERKRTLSAYNAFMATNLTKAIDKTGAEPVVDYSKLLISKGSLPPVKVVGKAEMNENNTITANFETNIGLPKIAANDEIILLILAQSGVIYSARQARGTKKEDSIFLVYRNLNVNDIKCCYIMTLSADGKKASNSVYVEIGGE